MAIQSNILAWKIPWTEESGLLQSMGLQRVRQYRTSEQACMEELISSSCSGGKKKHEKEYWESGWEVSMDEKVSYLNKTTHDTDTY